MAHRTAVLTALSISIAGATAHAQMVGSAGGLPGHDGALDNNDFIEMINRFFAPC